MVVSLPLPDAVVAALADPVVVGAPAQAFPFLTVDDGGAPHCCLLSSTEISVAADAPELYVALASRRTRDHLTHRPHATLLVVEGTTLHSCKLVVDATTGSDEGAVLGVALHVVDHHADSLGIALHPLGFVPPPEIAEIERWDRTAAALAAIRQSRT
jgi:hypothetical protein